MEPSNFEYVESWDPAECGRPRKACSGNKSADKKNYGSHEDGERKEKRCSKQLNEKRFQRSEAEDNDCEDKRRRL